METLSSIRSSNSLFNNNTQHIKQEHYPYASRHSKSFYSLSFFTTQHSRIYTGGSEYNFSFYNCCYFGNKTNKQHHISTSKYRDNFSIDNLEYKTTKHNECPLTKVPKRYPAIFVINSFSIDSFQHNKQHYFIRYAKTVTIHLKVSGSSRTEESDVILEALSNFIQQNCEGCTSTIGRIKFNRDSQN
ncbi:hypothetical protein NQZ68_037749 [Dissostichus eleginoides]|nr:hypothetical protein NQZ68_037749 [Dissostichus eleginoides]